MAFFHKVRISRNFFQLSEPRRRIAFQRLQHHVFSHAANADFISFKAELSRQANGLAAAVLKELGELAHFSHKFSIYLKYILINI